MRFGFELDTIQNWEQGRNAPDAQTQVLLKVIETHPEIVDEALGMPTKEKAP
jgi:DNA-binding transcriptional regulator YiaG